MKREGQAFIAGVRSYSVDLPFFDQSGGFTLPKQNRGTIVQSVPCKSVIS